MAQEGITTSAILDDSVQQPRESNYFAAAPSGDIAQELQKKVDGYYTYLISANLTELWRRAYRAYYGMRQTTGASGWGVFDTGAIIAAGDQGEIARVKVNHLANLITHQLSLTTGTRPELECRAVNSDAASLVSAALGDGVVEYFMRERKIERNYNLAIETALVLSEGYVVLGWDAKAGKEYGTGPNGSILYDGDLTARNYTPFQVIKDTTKNSDDEQNWYIVHNKKNRYDLMASYPNLADQIEKVRSDQSTASNRTFADPSKIIAVTSFGVQESDDIPYMEFYHGVTDAMPFGRHTIFVNGDLCLFDGPLPYREIPVYRVAPKNIIGTPFGWTTTFDILALQELIDKLYTIVTTNIFANGIQNFWNPPGNTVTPYQLAGGLNMLESPIRPELLQLLNTPAEVYNFINKVESVMETLSGISGINRGDLPTHDLSGSAMAFMASQAITFSSSLQSSANQLLESLGTGMVNILKDFAATPRIAIISGVQNRPLMKTYMGQDLEGINNVVCDATSALSKTTAGKISIADNLLATPGMIKTPQEYLTLIKTGNMEPMTRGPVMENFLIQQENEWLLQGKSPQVIRTDDHAQHIAEHKTLLASPSSREDGMLVENVLNHIAQHEQAQLNLQQNDPAILAAMGDQALPFPVAPPPSPQPQSGGAPNSNAAGIAGTVNPASGTAQKAATVKAPNMPHLPKGTDPQTQSSYQQLQSKGVA